MIYSKDFKEMVETFLRHGSNYEIVHAACIAQFILETGRGKSKLAKQHNNFAGMKWRKELSGVATKVLVDAPSETAYFCSFETIHDFVEGYWIFLGRAPYDGWEDHTDDAEDFIDFVGPIWAADPAYPEKLKDLLAEADALIEDYQDSAEGEDLNEEDAPCCEGMSGTPEDADEEWEKPTVEWDPSPFKWSRNGTEIDTIVMHYTTTRSLSSTVNWFKSENNTKRTSTHYIIGRDGTIIQMVKDSDACTHGNSQNRRSIGIEHSAAPGDKMTQKQEKSSIALLRWLKQEYDITDKRVIAHKCAPRATSCPGDLFKEYGATRDSNCRDTAKALQAWLADKVL